MLLQNLKSKSNLLITKNDQCLNNAKFTEELKGYLKAMTSFFVTFISINVIR